MDVVVVIGAVWASTLEVVSATTIMHDRVQSVTCISVKRVICSPTFKEGAPPDDKNYKMSSYGTPLPDGNSAWLFNLGHSIRQQFLIPYLSRKTGEDQPHTQQRSSTKDEAQAAEEWIGDQDKK